MPSFGPKSEDAVRKDILRIKELDRTALKEEQRLSIDYLKNRQVADVEKQLIERFESSQQCDPGQQIYPVTVPLTERFAAEAANAYNGSVYWYFVDDEGKESEATKEQTKKLNRALEKARYTEVMHACERYTVLLKLCCVWFQRKRFQLKPVIAFPYQVFPIAPDDGVAMDPSDPDDYNAFVIQQEWDTEDVTKASGSLYAYVSAQGVMHYTGWGPNKIAEVKQKASNPFQWEHVDESKAGQKVIQRRPGRMLTFWHDRLNVDELIPYCDATIARANRELNIAWSVLLDTIRFQSYATPVKKLTNPDNPGAKQRHGARFPVVVKAPIEDFKYEKSDAPYTETVQALDHYAKFMATLQRQSPSDFSIEGSKAISGFAKQVESLPKIEAREERLRVLTFLEEQEAAPRYVAILISTGELDPVAEKMQVRVKFADVEFPRNADEEAKEIETRIKYNLTTAAKILAKETGMAVEEAEEEIKANAEKNKELKSALQGTNGQPPGFPNNAFSPLIAKRRAQGAGPPTQENRQEGGPGREGDRDNPQGSPRAPAQRPGAD